MEGFHDSTQNLTYTTPCSSVISRLNFTHRARSARYRYEPRFRLRLTKTMACVFVAMSFYRKAGAGLRRVRNLKSW